MDKKIRFSQDQINLIKRNYAVDSTDDELKLFISFCEDYGLDPRSREVSFVKYLNKDKNGNYIKDKDGVFTGKVSFQVGRDGYLKLAQEHPDYEGILSFVVDLEDEFEIDAQNFKVTHRFGKTRKGIVGAWAQVNMKNRKPTIQYAPFSEYYKANVGRNPLWDTYPSAMILKVVETNAFHRAIGLHKREIEIIPDSEPEAMLENIPKKEELKPKSESMMINDKSEPTKSTINAKPVELDLDLELQQLEADVAKLNENKTPQTKPIVPPIMVDLNLDLPILKTIESPKPEPTKSITPSFPIIPEIDQAKTEFILARKKTSKKDVIKKIPKNIEKNLEFDEIEFLKNATEMEEMINNTPSKEIALNLVKISGEINDAEMLFLQGEDDFCSKTDSGDIKSDIALTIANKAMIEIARMKTFESLDYENAIKKTFQENLRHKSRDYRLMSLFRDVVINAEEVCRTPPIPFNKVFHTQIRNLLKLMIPVAVKLNLTQKNRKFFAADLQKNIGQDDFMINWVIDLLTSRKVISFNE